MALYRAIAADAASFPELQNVLKASIDRTEFGKYFEQCRARGAMAFDGDPSEMASLFISMAQSEWPSRISYGVVDGLSEDDIDRYAKLATQMFLRAVAPNGKKSAR